MLAIPHTHSKSLTILWLFLATLFTLQSVCAQVNLVPVTTVSAASYENAGVTPGSIASSFGTNLATTTAHATDLDPSTPAIELPTNLAGTMVQINGQFAGLLFVSPLQVNFVIPNVDASATTIKITSGDGTESNGTLAIAPVRPSIFTFNSNGQGVLAAEVVRVKANGAQLRESLVKRDEVTGQFVPKPIDLGPEGERVFLEIYLTGICGVVDENGDGNSNEGVYVLLGGKSITPSFAGRHPFFAGLDQVNLELPRSLLGSGKLTLAIHARVRILLGSRSTPGFTSNLVELELLAPPTANTGPQIRNFNVATASAGQLLVIDGSGFDPIAANNTVIIGSTRASVVDASSTQLVVRVPFSAITDRVKVKTSQGEGSSANNLTIRTSVTGFVETSLSLLGGLNAPLRNLTVRVVGTNISTKTNQEGVFTLLDAPAGSVSIEIDPSTSAAAWAFSKKHQQSLNVIAGRDNLLPASFWLNSVSGDIRGEPTSFSGYPIVGDVLDSESKTPLANVFVRGIGQNLATFSNSTITDSTGSFVIRNLPSDARVSARLIFSYINPDSTITRSSFSTAETVLNMGVVNFPISVGDFLLNRALTNRQPLLITPNSITMNVNEVKDFVIFVDDPDLNENLQVSVSGPQSTLIVGGADGNFTIRLNPKSGGLFTVRVTVKDSNGGQSEKDIGLWVYPLTSNTAPTVTVPGNQTVRVGQTLTFNASANDPDAGQTITLVAMNMPQGSSFIPASPVGSITGTFSWTPAANQVGTFTVTFTATDNANPPLSDTKTVTITVTP